ncbi:MAG: type III secretion system export apparatus subunit SctV [Kiritimatiellae bacterium]|nr:type III secretion system export apparatus subunit SctV [Kiritimatiellia bacterium]
MGAGTNRLANFSGALSRYGDLVLAFLLVCIIGLLIIPLPSFIVDLLISTNICISTILIMLSLYLPRALAFSTFPSMLLFTTLFRLALNVTTTRCILLHGAQDQNAAGTIINTFGNFVVGGNPVVGAVIFLIITIVQFVVIAKGAERVSEVAARFTLDAMPGKQMSIDADMRAGAIDLDTARARRAELGQESQLYGAMDGAMKFVKGDAIAGIIITSINIVGGILIGMLMFDKDAGWCVERFGILTIGDGLVGQIPALLISITAGIIVTRVGSEKAKPLGQEIVNQIFAQPKAILLGAGFLVLIGLIPGFPKIQLFGLALVTGLVGISLRRRAQAAAEAEARGEDPLSAAAPSEGTKPKPKKKDGDDFSMVTPLTVDIDAEIREALTYDELNDQIMSIRRALYHDLGVPFPGINLSLNQSLKGGKYRLLVNEVPVSEGTLRKGWVFALEDPENLSATGIPFEGGKAFLAGHETCWVKEEDKPRLDESGIRSLDVSGVLTYHLSSVLRRYAHEFLSLQETRLLFDHMEKEAGELVREVQRVLPLQKITDVLQRLVQEGICIRDLKRITQTLIEWGQKEKDAVLLVEYVRTALSRYISYKFSGGQNIVAAYLLDPSLEEKIRKSVRQTSGGSYLAMDPATVRSILAVVKRTVGDLSKIPQKPVVIVSVDIRRFFRKMIEKDYYELPVLSFQELSAEINIQPLGRLKL